MRRVGLPSGGSTLMTSAPSPASVNPQYSACSSASSMTRMPARGPGRAARALETDRSFCAAMALLPEFVTVGVRGDETFSRKLCPPLRAYAPSPRSIGAHACGLDHGRPLVNLRLDERAV